VTRKDVLLGKVDLSLETFGDVFRPPDDGNRYLPPATTNASTDGAPSSAAAAASAASTSAAKKTRRGSSSSSSSGGGSEKVDKAVRKSNLAVRTGVDFWVPLVLLSPHGAWAHAGELRLRVLLLPIPPLHRLAAQYSWLAAPPAEAQAKAGGSSSAPAVKVRSAATSMLKKGLVSDRMFTLDTPSPQALALGS
jgi:hypothetical protein